MEKFFGDSAPLSPGILKRKWEISSTLDKKYALARGKSLHFSFELKMAGIPPDFLIIILWFDTEASSPATPQRLPILTQRPILFRIIYINAVDEEV